MDDPATNQRPEVAPRAIWLVWLPPVLFIFATRLLTFVVGEPWLDELTNWQLATEHGLGLRPHGAHRLTYLFVAMGLALSDSTWGLRLSAAITGALTMALLYFWGRRHFSPPFAWAGLFLLGFSPMAIYYSQDANHYSQVILAGLLAVIAFNTLLKRGLSGLPVYLMLLVGTAAFYGFHPMVVFPLMAASSAPFFLALLHADTLVPGGAPLRQKWLLVVMGSVLIAGVLLNVLLHKFDSVRGFPPPVGRQFGLNFDFAGALLASFYGGIFVYSPLDITLGCLGVVLSVTGWVVMVRDPSTRWIGLGCFLVVAASVLPFTIVPIGQSFSPRYVAAILVPLLLGVARVLVWRPLLPGRWPVVLLVAFVLWGGVYTVRSISWNAHRLSGHFQQSFTSMEWIRGNTPEDAVFLTRNTYKSISTRLAWSRHDMGTREHLALSHDPLSAARSIQQIEERLYNSDRVHYLYYIEGLERMAHGFLQYVWSHTEEVVRLDSWSQDPFNTIVRNITISRIHPPEENPFALPRSGAAASSVYPEGANETRGNREEGYLQLRGISGAIYNVENERDVGGIRLSLELGEETARPRHLLFLINGTDGFHYQPDAGEEIVELLVPAPLKPGRHQLVLALPGHPFGRAGAQEVKISGIAFHEEQSDVYTARAVPLRSLGSAGEALRLGGGELPMTRPGKIIQRLDITVDPTEADDLLFLWQRQEVGGLGDMRAHTRLHPGGSRAISMGGGFDWLYSDGWRVAILPRDAITPGMHLETYLTAAANFYPRDRRMTIDPVLIYTGAGD
ncbi:MAG: glycosyltransferase family 39 protein [Candidatus Sumerlaeia bacterium]|nr:glycosyltransferase family 39 protein [Candidatus Sumerlaeia bacterium]